MQRRRMGCGCRPVAAMAGRKKSVVRVHGAGEERERKNNEMQAQRARALIIKTAL